MAWFFVVLGLVTLLLAGDFLVRAAVNLALRLGISALVVSLTVVAFGTSAPELLIVLSAMADDAPGLAMGNIVGSNTANILLVLGLPALVAGLYTTGFDTKKVFIFMILATVLFIILAFMGPFSWWHGGLMLAVLAAILLDQAWTARRVSRVALATEDLNGVDTSMPGWKITLYLLFGLVGLPLGAKVLVVNAEIIAREFGVPETAIGLTLIAVGTSLPELATTTVAAIRRQADVALGNVIGSNMFNLLAIIGIAALVGPIPVADEFLRFDLWVMLAASFLLIPFVFFGQNITRIWGAALTLLYMAYLLVVLL
ncbi:calcium/sodium antiporter [uncultured Planktomarina sp.]|uniref:calcium/sodium antiporter n=1 Tax=uncultured Planktomarina sp. TaxID=1538529 RepID=UPI0032610816|tara:strand:- start:127 stop:1065 length:939 start_codon:yes stop_codon:yes gene_type:complete